MAEGLVTLLGWPIMFGEVSGTRGFELPGECAHEHNAALHAPLHGRAGEAQEALYVLDLAEVLRRMANAEEREDLRPTH